MEIYFYQGRIKHYKTGCIIGQLKVNRNTCSDNWYSYFRGYL